LVLMTSPWIFDFAYEGLETWIPVIWGTAGIVYSLMTDYELGFDRRIKMTTHLTLDIVSGVLLAASPWIFGFARQVYLPHLCFGLLEIIVPILSKDKVMRKASG
ncbi:MAG: hypothetical protein ACJ75B_12240, partial [Flavisolibacter sp.]